MCATRFPREYEELVGVYTDPDKQTRERSRDPRAFFGGKCKEASFPNRQELDRDGLLGRVLSNSHMPKRGEAGYEEVVQRISEIFDRHEESGRVILHYISRVYHGALD